MEVLNKAMQWAKDNHPEASLPHKAAFANSVAYLVTGVSGGFGGPSIREHLVSWSLGEPRNVNVSGVAMTAIVPGTLPMPGDWNFKAAILHCDPLCFGKISNYRYRAIQIIEREYCFDDDPLDLESLRGKSV
jgi:hypothetical protein